VVKRLEHRWSKASSLVDQDTEECRLQFGGRPSGHRRPADGRMNVVVIVCAGKMFLPQVVKSARVMKKGRSRICCRYRREKMPAARPREKFSWTVKGDVPTISQEHRRRGAAMQ